MSMPLGAPIAACSHRDFYHWVSDARQDHLCVVCPLRVSYSPITGAWQVADVAHSLREAPVPLEPAEAPRADPALATVMARQRLTSGSPTPHRRRTGRAEALCLVIATADHGHPLPANQTGDTTFGPLPGLIAHATTPYRICTLAAQRRAFEREPD
jgi:hypothetical protein